MMKKIVAVIIILAAMLTSFAACNGSDNAEKSSDTVASETDTVPNTEESTPDEEDSFEETGAFSDTEPTTETEIEDKEEKPVSTKNLYDIIDELAPEATTMSVTSGCSGIIVNDVSKDAALKAFTDEGFEIVETVPIEGAKFETTVLLRKFDIVTMYWSEAENELRVFLEKTTKAGPYMLSPTDETGKGSVSIAQIGIDREKEVDNPLIGMCYIIKLSNGKAIIIDGGFNTDTCSDNIYNTLEKMEISKSSGQYEIEAWIITHGHADHVGAIKKLSSAYSTKVKVEHIISAFPGSDKVVEGGAKEQLASGIFSSAKRVIPHAGIKYFFGNVAISMFYTPDMIYAPGYTVANYNDSSLAFRIEGGGADVFFFGDAGEVAAEEMVASYESSAFKSDIVQITHHGLTTQAESGHKWISLKKVYEAIDADYGFLPMHSRYGTSGRNGRYTVMCQWGCAGYQMSFVINENDTHGLSGISQEYFDAFAASVANGTNTYETLLGYDGINKIVSENGLITYLGANESAPMVTVFELSDGNATLKTNETLCVWLGATEYLN